MYLLPTKMYLQLEQLNLPSKILIYSSTEKVFNTLKILYFHDRNINVFRTKRKNTIREKYKLRKKY